jgi:hypothetical protein
MTKCAESGQKRPHKNSDKLSLSGVDPANRTCARRTRGAPPAAADGPPRGADRHAASARTTSLRIVEAGRGRTVLAERPDVLVDVRAADDRDEFDLKQRAPRDFADPATTQPLLGCDEPESERIVCNAIKRFDRQSAPNAAKGGRMRTMGSYRSPADTPEPEMRQAHARETVNAALTVPPPSRCRLGPLDVAKTTAGPSGAVRLTGNSHRYVPAASASARWIGPASMSSRPSAYITPIASPARAGASNVAVTMAPGAAHEGAIATRSGSEPSEAGVVAAAVASDAPWGAASGGRDEMPGSRGGGGAPV